MAKKIAVLVEADYQDLEVWYPYLRLKEAGYEVLSVGTGSSETYRGKNGYPIVVDTNINEINPGDFAAVIIPGGWAPDKLRMFPKVIDFVRELFNGNRVVAAICHAGWVIATADIVKGKTVTCYQAIKDDLIHAGADYVDREVVVDGNLITSRMPSDLPAFCREILKALR